MCKISGNIMSSLVSYQHNKTSSKIPRRDLDIVSFQNPVFVDDTNDTEEPECFLDENSAAHNLVSPTGCNDQPSRNSIELNTIFKKDETNGHNDRSLEKPEIQLTKVSKDF